VIKTTSQSKYGVKKLKIVNLIVGSVITVKM